MKKWLKRTLAIMLIAVLMPVTSSFAVEENMTDFNEVNSITAEDEIVKITEEDGLSVIGCSSYAESETPDNAIDGNYSTIWQSNYEVSDDYDGFDKERYLVFDLGKEYYLSKVIYYPRLSGYNGKFKDCDVYVSTDNSDWYLLKAEKNWANDTEPKEVVIENPTLARYVKIVGVNTYLNDYEASVGGNENRFASAAEIEFYVDTVSEIIEKQPVGGKITAVGNGIVPFNLSVSAKENSTYQWFSNTEKSYQNAVEIENANKNTYMVPNETKYYFVKVTNGDKSVYSDIVMVEKADITEAATIYEAMITRESGNYYGSFVNAVNSAQNGETVKLLRDIELSQAINIYGKKITIDGHNEGDNFTINLKNPNNNISCFFSIQCKDTHAKDTEVIFDGVTIDGGAVWSGDTDATLQRGTTNIGQTLNSSCFSVSKSATLKIINGCVIQNNASTDTYKEIIYVTVSYSGRPHAEVYIENSIIRNNICRAVVCASGVTAGYTDTDVYINNSEIYGNQNNNNSEYGSIIYLERRSAAEVSGGSIHNNNGGMYGGAFNIGGTCAVTIRENARIENNKAQYGGAFYLNGSDSSFNLNDCTVRQNYADSDGGAIYISDGTVNVSNNGKLENNSARNSGGAIYLSGGTLNLNECQFNNNTSKGTGGAIGLNEQSNGTVNLGNATFSGNKSNDFETYEGGRRSKGNAIFYFGGTVNIVGQPVLTENDDIYIEYSVNAAYSNFEKINILTDNLEEKSITIVPQYCKTYHFIADFDPSIQDTVDRQAILKAFYFPKELNLGEKAVYIKGNEILYGDPVNCTKDIPQTMIKFTETEEENPSCNFQLSVKVTGTNITYKWYESDTVNGTYTLMENETKNTLNITGMGYGKKYYYCEIDNGELSANGPYKSTICKVEVSEFYPCSQAIDKFERV